MDLRSLFLSACALLFLAACENREPDRTPDIRGVPSTLRAYTVPPERAQQLQDALNGVLGKKGSATRAAPDKILVLAPAILQSSVADAIELLVKDIPPPVAEVGPVRLQVWVVDVAESNAADPRLQALSSTLDAIRESLAAPGYELFSQYAVSGSVGEHQQQTTVDDRGSVIARLIPTAGGTNADLSISVGRMVVKTQTNLKFGETVVLAQATPEHENRSRVRLIVVRADPAG